MNQVTENSLDYLTLQNTSLHDTQMKIKQKMVLEKKNQGQALACRGKHVCVEEVKGGRQGRGCAVHVYLQLSSQALPAKQEQPEFHFLHAYPLGRNKAQ